MSNSQTDNNDFLHDSNVLIKVRNIIRERINGRNLQYLNDLPEVKEITDLINKSIEFRESNSVLLCGPPGCGKTTLILQILNKLKKDNIIYEDNARVVRLNGLIHTDDKVALKDIARQLKLGESSECSKFKSFQENLSELFDRLKEVKNKESLQPCIILILDEFHLFCLHKNQILLYNLFDVAHSAKFSFCVIGLTHYSDIADLMEKRVLSRFSHRIIWLKQNVPSETRLKIFKEIFTLNEQDFGKAEEKNISLWNAGVYVFSKSKDFIDLIESQQKLDAWLGNFKNILLKLLISHGFEKALFSIKTFQNECPPTDYGTLTLVNLSSLEFGLIIAVRHYLITYGREPFNFEMVFSQYLKFCGEHSSNLIMERPVILKVFQRLEELEILIPVKKTTENGLGKIPLEYRLYSLNLTNSQICNGAKMHKELPTIFKQWLAASTK